MVSSSTNKKSDLKISHNHVGEMWFEFNQPGVKEDDILAVQVKRINRDRLPHRVKGSYPDVEAVLFCGEQYVILSGEKGIQEAID